LRRDLVLLEALLSKTLRLRESMRNLALSCRFSDSIVFGRLKLTWGFPGDEGSPLVPTPASCKPQDVEHDIANFIQAERFHKFYMLADTENSLV
jgi:hypothetical protein